MPHAHLGAKGVRPLQAKFYTSEIRFSKASCLFFPSPCPLVGGHRRKEEVVASSDIKAWIFTKFKGGTNWEKSKNEISSPEIVKSDIT